MLLYNRVQDSQPVDLEPCASLAPAAAAAAGTFRIAAAHGYGELLVRIEPGGDSRGYLVFELVDISGWDADPKQTHVVWPRFCPTDMCDRDCYGPNDPKGSKHLPNAPASSLGLTADQPSLRARGRLASEHASARPSHSTSACSAGRLGDGKRR